MRNPAAQGAADANASEVKAWYEELFCSVIDTHTLGDGFPDLVVGIAGVTEVVEIKTAHGHLLESQIEFQRRWRGRHVVLVRDNGDVINHVQRVREEVSRRERWRRK
jgi:hypothetical protein